MAGFEAWVETTEGDGLRVGIAEFPEKGDLFILEPLGGGPLVALNDVQTRQLAAYIEAALAVRVASRPSGITYAYKETK